MVNNKFLSVCAHGVWHFKKYKWFCLHGYDYCLDIKQLLGKVQWVHQHQFVQNATVLEYYK